MGNGVACLDTLSRRSEDPGLPACVVDTKGKEHTHHKLSAAMSILPGPGDEIAAAAVPYQACLTPTWGGEGGARGRRGASS